MTTQTNQPGKVRRNILKTVLLLSMTVATLTVSAQTTALSKQITLESRTQTRQQAIEAITAQTGLKVISNARQIDNQATVNFGRTSMALDALLNKLTEGTGQTYSVDNNYIIIHRAGESKATTDVTVTAVRNLAGTVTNKAGEAIEGVSVELVGTKDKTATTFANGRFQIEGVQSGNHIVKLTSADGQNIRYREVNVPTDRNADVTLKFGDEILTTTIRETTNATNDATQAGIKHIRYFVPSAFADNTIRAFEDEPKTQMFFAAADQVNKNYMPRAAVKTNLLYLGTTTLNVAAEFALAPKWTLDLSAAYNPFMLQKGGVNKIWFVQPEARYWFCQRFEKHFIGLHGIYGQFNVGEVTFLTKAFEQHRYDGWGAGAGVSWGYHLPMSKRWSWEFTVGAGVIYYEYDQFRCYECDDFEGRKSGIYYGPTKLGVSLIFMIR